VGYVGAVPGTRDVTFSPTKNFEFIPRAHTGKLSAQTF
jgi:hypothetical protein